jgi:hypothetical protein
MNPIPGSIVSSRIRPFDEIRSEFELRNANGFDGKIIITPHLINIHLISPMGCNFSQLYDPIGSDCKIQSDSNTIDPLVIPQPGFYESEGFLIGSLSNPIRSDYRI